MNIETMTTEAIKTRLAEVQRSMEEGLLEASKLTYELLRRGEYKPHMGEGVMRYFREIATGKLLPEVVLGFDSRPAVVTYLTRLDPPEQAKLVRGEQILVAEHNEHGEILAIRKDPATLTEGQWDLAIGDAGYRPFAQQREILAARGQDVRRSNSAIALRLDEKAGEIVCGRMRLRVAEVLYLLTAHGYTVSKQKEAA